VKTQTTKTHLCVPVPVPFAFTSALQWTVMEATNANAWKQLEDLKVIRHKTWLLEKAKQQILHNSQMVQNEEELIREYELEREILLEERRRRLQDLQAIQKDIQQVK
jgi:hypothetical protein